VNAAGGANDPRAERFQLAKSRLTLYRSSRRKFPLYLAFDFPLLRARDRSGFHREAFGYDLRLIQLAYRGEGNDVRFTTRANRLALARRARGTIRDIQGSLARKSDRARRRYVRATSPRPDAILPLRLPGRHVRLLRHDRERPAAVDLPHACRHRRRRWRLEIGPLANLPVIKDLAADL